MKYTLAEVGIIPIGHDKHGPKYLQSDVDKAVFGMIKAQTYFTWRFKETMKDDYDAATELLKQSEKAFSESLSKFQGSTAEVGAGVKKASGQIRDAAHRLNDSLAKVEKAANFDRLERYVDLLERANAAMQALAELESTGRLSKITQAIK